jgi:glycosyltransferase involved in cell wall biosynthesis
MKQMRLTVAICTWNRAELLERTLACLTEMSAPATAQFEVLVVNNNCTDETDAVIAAFHGRLPLRRIAESSPGLSRARNAAVAAATGDYILWTDDDVLVGKGWIRAYERAIQHHPRAGFFGGPIYPWFDGKPPRWLVGAWPEISNAYAAVDLGTEEFRLDTKRLPFGANYAIQTDAQRRVPYDPNLGRTQDGRLLSGEETAVLQELLKQGEEGWWVPDATVHHWVPGTRQNPAYLRTYFKGHGERMFAAAPPPGRHVVRGLPLWVWRHWLTAEVLARWNGLTGNHAAWGRHFMEASVARGMIQAAGREPLLKAGTSRGRD